MITNCSDYRDAAQWGTLASMKINEILKTMAEIQMVVHNLDFSSSKVSYKTQNRYATPAIFYRNLLGGRKEKRNWLLYSNSIGKVYCCPCKLFEKIAISNPIVIGFNDWKHADLIAPHENSAQHQEYTKLYANRLNSQREYFKNVCLVELINNINYWKKIFCKKLLK